MDKVTMRKKHHSILKFIWAPTKAILSQIYATAPEWKIVFRSVIPAVITGILSYMEFQNQGPSWLILGLGVIIVPGWIFIIACYDHAENRQEKGEIRELKEKISDLSYESAMWRDKYFETERLLQQMNGIVAAKSKRLYLAVDKYGKDREKLDAEIRRVNDFKSSIDRIIDHVYYYFTNSPDIIHGQEFRITYMIPVSEGKNLQIYSWAYPEGRSPKSLHCSFEYGKTAAGRCWESGRMCIIENTKTDQRYERIHNGHKEDDGSALFFPVSDNYAIGEERLSCIGVLNIDTNRPFFREKNSQNLGFVLNSFATRILFEQRKARYNALLN